MLLDVFLMYFYSSLVSTKFTFLTNFILYLQNFKVSVYCNILKKKKSSVKIGKLEYRSAIKYLLLKGMSPSEVHQIMINTLKVNAPSYYAFPSWSPFLSERIIARAAGRVFSCEIMTLQSVLL